MRSRIEREKHTVRQMIGLYCRQRHHSGSLCPECLRLLEYAERRLESCPFQEGKTVCAKCPVHCYKPDMRERIKEVMRYSGPRMLWRHPVAAVQYLIDKRRQEPISSVPKRS